MRISKITENPLYRRSTVPSFADVIWSFVKSIGEFLFSCFSKLVRVTIKDALTLNNVLSVLRSYGLVSTLFAYF